MMCVSLHFDFAARLQCAARFFSSPTAPRYIGVCALIALIAAMMAIGPAAAQDGRNVSISGEFLLNVCEDRNTPENRTYCLGYVVGLFEGMIFGAGITLNSAGLDFENAEKLNEAIGKVIGFCRPPSLPDDTLIEMLVGFLRQNEQARNSTARAAVWELARARFRCTP